MSHPAYDAFWRDQALDKILAEQGVTVPTMLVHSLWDQEDIYGNIAAVQGAQGAAARSTPIYIWCSGRGFITRSASTAARRTDSNSAATPAQYFRLHVLRPFLDHYLERRARPRSL